MLEAVSAPTLRAFCLRLLETGELEAKLEPPPPWLDDRRPGPAVHVERPARAPGLELVSAAGRLPRPTELGDPRARATCLARFAHHELQTVELFAWALLRWPELPPSVRRAWLGVLRDEQRHCRLYLARLAAHGSSLAEHPLSDYFWKHARTIASAAHGPRAFVASVGLTFEQANLDFSGIYADAFRAAGDPESAAVCERVHADEIGHVRLALRALRSLATEADDLDAYRAAVPFPLGAARAKGRRFDAEARRRAGLSERFIAHVAEARPTRRAPRADAP